MSCEINGTKNALVKTSTNSIINNNGGYMTFSILKLKRLLFLGSLLILALSATNLFAQTGTTGISGSVTDAQGAVVAGASVTLLNAEKGVRKNVITNESGTYNFASLLPDTYSLEVEKTGFKKYVRNNIKALIDSPIMVNVSLEIGDIGEIVTVTADSIDSLVNTTDGSIGTNFQPQQIQQLPTDSRNIASLLSLQPGVTRDGYVNGGRSDQANITLDGVDINDQQRGTDGTLPNGEGAFFSVLRITAESIEEFRVTTSNPNAGQGRSSGAQISLSTKSGNNDFRGAAFFIPRRTSGSANTFTNNRDGVDRPNINRNIFGGAFGGPIVKDKFFFFYSYEGKRENPGVEVLQTVPLASLGQGNFRFVNSSGVTVTVPRETLQTIYATAGLNPVAISTLGAVANRYQANSFSSAAGDNLNTAGFRFNATTPYNENTHILRLDYNINANQQLFVRGNKQHDVQITAPAFPDTPSPELWDHNTGIAVGHNWTIGNNKVNSFRYGLTRQAFTAGGDSNQNAISFRFVYSPLNYSYSLSRVTPVQNFTDDFTWTFNKHLLQFGGNIRIIRNKREDIGSGYDSAVINPSYYASSGRSLLTPLANAGYGVSTTNLLQQAAIAALIGRYSQYTANYNYDISGNLLPVGTPIKRNFATEEYDMYIQDSWKMFQGLTLNYGLRYALSRPVYEKNGYQIRPSIPLGEYFDRRVQSAAQGTAYNEVLNFELAGPKNQSGGYYSLDKNNFQPRVSAAWSPNFKNGFWSKFFGKDNESIFRGGFAITNDYFGQQLAVSFNGLSTLGFLTSDSIGPNTYNVTSNLGPSFTGFGQQVNTLPGVSPLPNRFQTPADQDTRIEASLDSTLVSPINYNWSFTYGRKLPKGFYIEASYIGRKARNLLVARDIMAPNNLFDPRSKMDWYSAAGKIYDAYYSGQAYNSVAPIPYFENLFPQLAGYFNDGDTATQTVAFLNENYALGDWTYLQYLLDDSSVFFDDPVGKNLWSNLFYQPQYAAFSAFSTVGRSDYHGGNLSIRQRLNDGSTFDFNYTLSKSMDDSSGLQTSNLYGSAFILNALRQKDSYSYSDFDVRHSINANGIWQIPFGKGRHFFKDLNPVAEALIGGWQLGGIFRWNSGKPFWNLTDLSGWATNWNLRSSAVRTRPIQSSPTRGGNGKAANVFSDLNKLLASIRPPKPGETGDRNVFRGTGYSVVDMNLGKTFRMPWSENHKLQFRWEVFNIFNHQYLNEDTIGAFSFVPGIPLSQSELTPGSGEYSGIKGNARRMQFFLRYSF